jgi:nitroreductase
MDAITLLTTRQSSAVLTAPAPSHEAIDLILRAGMRVPDHAGLTPWRFTLFKDDGLQRLAKIFEQTASSKGFSDTMIEKARNMPSRAPLIIMVSTQYQSHVKVPKQEQLLAAGCCVHAMQQAAFALGLGAIWRTGDFCYFDEIKSALNIALDNDIVGFLYIGQVNNAQPIKPTKDYQPYVNFITTLEE